MHIPVIKGLIRRRLLLNFRVDAQVMRDYLPHPFTPKLHNGFAIAGICLIRLEQIRPSGMPDFLGIYSENAAHRIAVNWQDRQGRMKEGVYIPRRDTGSLLNYLAGGRVFPGEHNLADFTVKDNGTDISMSIRSKDGKMSIDLDACSNDEFPPTSCFASLEESSRYFSAGSIGYSVTRKDTHLDGIRLDTVNWQVQALETKRIESSFFNDEKLFPAGSLEYDHALIMRDLQHQWHEEPPILRM